MQDLIEVNKMGADPTRAYARHIAQTVWDLGGGFLQYDTKLGQSNYGMSSGGGRRFKLSSFLNKMLPCNCQDLAGMLQVCLKALGKKPDNLPVSSFPLFL